MALSEVAAVSRPGWDTVKDIVRNDMESRYRHIRLREMHYLAVNEFHFGRKATFNYSILLINSVFFP